MLTHFSLCSGIGGLDLAAECAGFKTIAQSEIDPYASRVLKKNFPGVHNFGDIRTITNESVRAFGINPGGITVVSAGFPCQPYSLAGKGLGDRDGRDLWNEVARVIGELDPPWVVLENTPGLFARKNQRYFARVVESLSALGYSVGWGMWGACDVGAWHKRERVFIIAHRNADRVHASAESEVSQGPNAEPCGNNGHVFNADGFGRDGKNKIQIGEFGEAVFKAPARESVGAGGAHGVIPHADGQRQLQPQGRGQNEWERLGDGCQKIFHAASCGRYNGCRTARDDRGERWAAEPDVGRVADGVPARVDRLRGLGNAVVPEQAYPVFAAIAEYEGGIL